MRLIVSPRRLLVVLPLVVASLTVVSLVLSLVDVRTSAPPFDGFNRLLLTFDTDLEANVPAWFSTALLLSSALLLWGTAKEAAARGDRWTRHWGVLALALAYISLDELSQLHELAIPQVDALLGTRGVLTFGWVIIAAPLVLVFAALYVGFLRALPRRTAVLFLLAGAVYVGGALGVELVGGWIYDEMGPETVAYVLATSVEELGEMLGASLFLFAVADHQHRRLPAPRSAREHAAEPSSPLRAS